MGKFKPILILGGMVSLVIGAHIRAEEISVPYPFSPGTMIRSSEMNENFQTVYDKVNEQQRLIEQLQQQIAAFHGDLTDGLVAYYPFNGNANDESGNENHGIVRGASLTIDRFGNDNAAYSFDGQDDYIEIPDSNSLSNFSNKITVGFWMNIPSIPTEPGREFYVLGKMRNNHMDIQGDIQGFNMALSTWGNPPHKSLFFRAIDSPTRDGWHIGADIKFNDIPINQSINIVFAYDSNESRIYLNGELYASGIDSNGMIGNNDEPLTIGFSNWSSGSRFFQGVIDDLRVYNRALFNTEVQFLYNMETP